VTIVVGAGAAGAPLAARLSEDASRRVVVVEAGATPPTTDAFPAELLDGGTVRGAMPGHPANWSYTGNLTPDLPYTIARGRILGGSSTINGGYFVRARPEDFARWETEGGPDWSYERTLPLMRALERDLDYGETGEHGGTGPVPVKRASQQNPAAVAFREAALELGFSEEPDKNAPGTPGVGPVPQNVVDGVRWNTGMTYLNPVRDRENLVVLGETRARRILFDGRRAVGLEVESTDGIRVLEADEVVLCAGAIASPHLLLVSGVGPAAQLERHAIPVVYPAEGVGRAFSDHPEISVGWRSRQPIVDDSPETFVTGLNFSSPAGDPAGDLEILLSVKPTGYLLTGSQSTIAGGMKAAARHPLATLSALAGVSARRFRDQVVRGNDLVLLVAVQSERSRGTIRLRSSNPLDDPQIDYHYLADAADRARMRHAVRTAVALLRAHAFARLFDRLTELDDTVLDDDRRLDEWMLRHLGTAIHMCGSAPMGPEGDPGAVVDGHGRVHGVEGLRVADTSILPTTPSRGPAATAVLIGELVARAMRQPSS